MLFENGNDVVFAEEDEFFVADSNFRAAVLGDENVVAYLYFKGNALAVAVELAAADGRQPSLPAIFPLRRRE